MLSLKEKFLFHDWLIVVAGGFWQSVGDTGQKESSAPKTMLWVIWCLAACHGGWQKFGSSTMRSLKATDNEPPSATETLLDSEVYYRFPSMYLQSLVFMEVGIFHKN